VQYGFSDAAGNQSAADRPRFWAGALRYSRSEPGGLGWGAFTQLPISGNSEDRYPHNLWIELALEAGWLASLATLAITLVAFVRAVAFAQSSDGVAGGALAALLLFGMTNASVSGDVNDNRTLFTLICITICASLPGAELDADGKDEYHAC
jgi:O-antigen ligase